MSEPSATRTITGASRVAAAFGSPMAVLIVVPLLVLGIGAFMGVTGQLSLTRAVETLAKARFADRMDVARARVEEVLGQADILHGHWRLFLESHAHSPSTADLASYLITLMSDRSGVSWVSFGREDGAFFGVYLDDQGRLVASDRRVLDDGTSPLEDFLIAPDGSVTSIRLEQDSGYDVRIRPYYRFAREQGRRAWTDPYVFFDSGVAGITSAEPYYDRDGTLIGVASVDFNLNDLSGFIESLNSLEGERLFVFTEDHTLIAYPGSRQTLAANQQGKGILLRPESVEPDLLLPFFEGVSGFLGGEQSAQAGPVRHFEIRDALGERSLAAVQPVSLTEGFTVYIGALAPATVFLGPARQHRMRALWIGAGALAVALAVAGLFAWNLNRTRHEVLRARARARIAELEARELGSYRLVAKLGQGAMGEVWRAEHRLLARPAAIKLIRAQLLEGKSAEETEEIHARFEREARVTAELSSPHTVRLYDFGHAEDGTFYHVMELLDGLDLQDLVDREGPQPVGRVVRILNHIASSLSEAHRKGLVHRDLKPANVFLTRGGDELDVTKVLDFGVVHLQPGSQVEAEFIGNGSTNVTGTPAFMAPEQALGRGHVDGRTDLYALGCLGYWLLTGRTVFPRDDALAVIMDHANRDPEAPSRHAPGVPAELDALILSLLSKDPEHRPQDARTVIRTLAEMPIPPEGVWDESAREKWWSAFTARKPTSDAPRQLDIVRPAV